MSGPILSYCVRPDGTTWRWEVFAGNKVIGSGFESTSVAARVRAFLFVLRSGTLVSR